MFSERWRQIPICLHYQRIHDPIKCVSQNRIVYTTNLSPRLTWLKVTYRYYLGMLSFLNEEYSKVSQVSTFTFFYLKLNIHLRLNKN